MTASEPETFAKKHGDLAFLSPDRDEKLDAYLPDEERWPGHRPAVVLIHGGGWVKGDKAEPRQTQIAATLTRRGFAVFSINYRLTQFSGEILKSQPVRSCWPECLDDCRAAVRFVRQGAERWRVDPRRIALFGLSAGAHLAMLAAVTAYRENDLSSAVSSVIEFYGPHDLREIGSRWHFGEPLPDPAAIRAAASPVQYFAPGMPPLFLAHGLEDKTVPVYFARAIVEEFRRHGVPCEAHLIAHGVHGFSLSSPQADLRAPVLSFLEKTLVLG